MKRVLVTTLGKGGRNAGDSGYKTVRYRFGSDDVSSPTPFFGLALYKYLQRCRNVDKVVILGTAGSIWDAWWEADDRLAGEKYCGLFDRVKSGVRDEQLLSGISHALSEVFGGAFACRYIPDDAGEDSCREIMRLIDAEVDKDDEIHIDVTHGFRYLPMIELLSTFFLKLKGARLGGIYYGALENIDREANAVPVVELSSLARVEEWIEAMSLFRTTGNPSLLAKIDSMQCFKADLEQYCFFVQMNNIRNARGAANRIVGLVNKNRLPPEGELFRQEFIEQFDWGGEQYYAKRQYRQYRAALDNGDMLRAVLLLFEMTITAFVRDPQKVTDSQEREVAKQELMSSGDEDWTVLRRLRNSVVHDGVADSGWRAVDDRLDLARRSHEAFVAEIKRIESKVLKLIRRQ